MSIDEKWLAAVQRDKQTRNEAVRARASEKSREIVALRQSHYSTGRALSASSCIRRKLLLKSGGRTTSTRSSARCYAFSVVIRPVTSAIPQMCLKLCGENIAALMRTWARPVESHNPRFAEVVAVTAVSTAANHFRPRCHGHFGY